ncbi:MAG: hypothetical protein IT318_20295 [Anaerolineales bacterium]|nr:hypothetical protein [Anaerolineales bacterium]
MAWLQWGDFYVDDATGQSYGGGNVPPAIKAAAVDLARTSAIKPNTTGGTEYFYKGQRYASESALPADAWVRQNTEDGDDVSLAPGVTQRASTAGIASLLQRGTNPATPVPQKLRDGVIALAARAGLSPAEQNSLALTIMRGSVGAGALGEYGAINLTPRALEFLRSIAPALPDNLDATVASALSGRGLPQTSPGESFYGDLLPDILSGQVTGPLTRDASGKLRPASVAGGPAAAVTSATASGAGAGAGDAGASGGGDDLAAFRQAFKAAHGRDVTAAELADYAYLQTLSNEQIRTLPQRILNGFATSRLAQLSNEDLLPIIRANPNFLGGFSAERLLTFAPEVIMNEFVPFLRKAGATGHAANLEAGVKRAGGSDGGSDGGGGAAPPPGTTPPGTTPPPSTTPPGTTPPASNNPLEGVQPLAPGQFGKLPDFSNLSDLSLDYYFDFANNPAFASQNYLQSAGINPFTGNPFGEFLGAQIVPQAQLASDYNTVYGQNSGMRGVLGALGNFFGEGGGMFPSDQQASSFLGDLNQLVNDYAAGKVTDVRKAGLAQDITSNPNRAFDVIMGANRGSISPFLRNNRRLMASLQDRLYSDYMRNAPQKPDQSFLGSLLGG